MKANRFDAIIDLAAHVTVFGVALASRVYKVNVRLYNPTSGEDFFMAGDKPAGVRSWADPLSNEVVWDPFGGIEGLLHEIGHLKCKHLVRGQQIYSGDPNKRAVVLRAEREAWVWADREAQKLGFPFDHAFAEWNYAHYACLVPPEERTPIAWENHA